MKKSVKILLSVLCVVFLGVFAFSGYKIYSTLHEYKVAEKAYSNLSNQYVSKADKDKGNKNSSDKNAELVDPLSKEETSPISVDFTALQNECEDIIAWLYGPDTVIDYPIVHAEDNFFYLRRMINGEYNPSGTLFIDCLKEGDFSSQNTLLYGHNMHDGSMFASMRNYDQQEYYDAHPILYMNTPEQNYRIEVFAAYITDADSDTYTMNFGSQPAYAEYLKKVVSQSLVKTDVTPEVSDHIITFSTCTYEYADARFVVLGRLVPIN